MSDTRPQFTLEQDGMFTRVNMGYTNDALDAMAQRVAERIEDELAQQLLARLGYVKPVRCRDCKHRHRARSWAGTDEDECWLHASPETGALGKVLTDPDGFCAWGKRKEVDK